MKNHLPDANESRRWLRHLQCELPTEESRELERELAEDGELAARFLRFSETWNGLEGPPATPVPDDFSARVVAATRRQARGAGELSWGLAPAWARAGSVAALLAGLALGVSVAAPVSTPELAAGDDELDVFSEPLSLSESFWLEVRDSDGAVDSGETGGESVP